MRVMSSAAGGTIPLLLKTQNVNIPSSLPQLPSLQQDHHRNLFHPHSNHQMPQEQMSTSPTLTKSNSPFTTNPNTHTREYTIRGSKDAIMSDEILTAPMNQDYINLLKQDDIKKIFKNNKESLSSNIAQSLSIALHCATTLVKQHTRRRHHQHQQQRQTQHNS